jgi:protein gp37
MGDKSGIEWTDATWNPVTGCTKVSPGCAHCYIDRSPPFRIEGRKFVNGSTDVRLHPDRLTRPLSWTRPRMIFVNSLSDLWHPEVPFDYIDKVFETMVAARERGHTFQVLTKRPARMHEWAYSSPERLDGILRGNDGDPWPHIWLGVTIENGRHTGRADLLRKVPAHVHFISAEPLLDSLFASDGKRTPLDLDDIEWLIAGGESGPDFRALNVDHVRELRDACVAADVAFFFKQHGGIRPKSNGKMLDGREWTQLPVA